MSLAAPASPRVAFLTTLVLACLCAASGFAPGRSGAGLPHAAAAARAAESHHLRKLALTTKDLVVDSHTQTIYVSVPSSVGAGGNSITPINAQTGTPGQPVFVGSEPGDLAIADGGEAVYAVLEGANAVRRFDTQTQTAGVQFNLGNDSFSGPVTPRQIKVAPGNPETVAVQGGGSMFDSRLFIFDNGVRRGNSLASAAQQLEFSASATRLYSSNSNTSVLREIIGLQRINLTPTGPSNDGNPSQVPVITGEIKFDNGRLYAASGHVYNPETGALLGQFTAPDFAFHKTTVVPDSAVSRVYFVSVSCCNGTPKITLRAFDMNTFAEIGSIEIPDAAGTPTSLVRWGANGLAFRNANKVYLLQHNLIGGTSPTFTPAPTPAPPTVSLRGRITDFNGGAGGVGVALSGSLTTSTTTDTEGNFTIPGVGICDVVTVTPSKPTYTFGPASVEVLNPVVQPSLNITAFPRAFSLSQSQSFISENFNHVRFNVSRQGDLSVAAAVDYETSDGTAVSRSDYTAAFGTLRFAPGEASKPIDILITNDVLVEGFESFILTLRNPTDGFILHPTFATVFITVSDNDTQAPTTSPLQDAQFFVRRHYHDFLNRDPSSDIAGLNFWAGQITACESEPDPQKKADCLADRRTNVSAAFFLSIEFQQTGYLVHRFYTASYPDSPARPKGLPRLAEFLRDTQEVGRGVVVGVGDWTRQLEENKQSFALAWVERPEFLAQHSSALTAGQFVDALFANSGAVPAANERAAAIAAFGAGGTEGRARALSSVAESGSVYNRQYNSAFVLMQYFGYMRRNPNDAPDTDYRGYQFWLGKLDEFSLPGEDVRNESVAFARARRAEMVKAFIVSLEYAARFGPTNFDISR